MVESLIRPQHNTGTTMPLLHNMLLPLSVCICPGENKTGDQKLAERLIRYLKPAVHAGGSKGQGKAENGDS